MKVVIFGGTTEGRQLAEYLIQLNKKQKMQTIEVHVCVASEYGAQVLPEDAALKVHVGRLEQADMQEFLQAVQADLCVDATHPYAVIVTQNIYQACKAVEVPYIRVRREMHTCEASDRVYVEDTQAAVDYLKGATGNILITTGSKELHLYTQIPDYESRCTARVLPTQSVVEACTELGFTGKHLICMQGPFDLEMNLAIAKQGPSAAHIFGTDDLGRDILSRILYGGRYSMSLGFLSVGLGAIVAMVIGSIAGYFGGWVDNLLMRMMDVLSAIPGMLLSIIVAAALGTAYHDTVTPKSMTLRTVPVSSMPGFKSFISSTSLRRMGAGSSSRGSRPGLLSSFAMSSSVGSPTAHSAAALLRP